MDQVFQDTPQQCVACHAEPEIHFGIFGTDCANCHTVDGWLPAQLRQHTFPLDHGEQGTLECTACHTAPATQPTTAPPATNTTREEMVDEHDELNLTQAELMNCAPCHPTGHEDEAENDE